MEINYSFIIPHHNQPDLLQRCVNTIPIRNDIEIIVVDDNSDFDKRPTLSRTDVKIIYINKNNSKGAGHARNVGLDNAIGKWLLFADGDDFYEKGFLEKLDLYNDANIDVLYFDAYNHDKLMGIKRTYFINRYIKDKSNNRNKKLLAFCSNEPWNKMYKKNFIDNYKIRFDEIPLGNDATFVITCGYYAKNIECLPEKLYYYVDNDTGITRRLRPIEHHYISLRSQIKRNHMFIKAGVGDLVPLRIESHKIVPRYGFMEYLKIMAYYYIHDWSLVLCFFIKIYRKITEK